MLIAALLELKSRLMLPREDEEELDLEPGEAADELLARMLEARRYRRAAEHLAERLAGEHGHRYRSAPLPPSLRRGQLDPDAEGVYDPGAARQGRRGAAADAGADFAAAPLDPAGDGRRAPRAPPRLLRRGGCSFDEAVRGADRVTVAVTLFSLLELYKRGEADWVQAESSARSGSSRAAWCGATTGRPAAQAVAS